VDYDGGDYLGIRPQELLGLNPDELAKFQNLMPLKGVDDGFIFQKVNF
jgi:hypothetical protein